MGADLLAHEAAIQEPARAGWRTCPTKLLHESVLSDELMLLYLSAGSSYLNRYYLSVAWAGQQIFYIDSVMHAARYYPVLVTGYGCRALLMIRKLLNLGIHKLVLSTTDMHELLTRFYSKTIYMYCTATCRYIKCDAVQ